MSEYLTLQKTAFLTIYRREVKRFLRIWVQTLLPSPILLILYFMIFGKVIGSKVGLIQGVSYLEYITPGLIMLGLINNTFNNVVSSFFSSKFQRSIEEMLIAPISPLTIMTGYVLGGMTRGLISAGIGLIIAEFLTDFHLLSPSTSFFILILTSYFFAQAGLTNGIYAKKFDDISVVPTFVLTPMIYLGGVFYSIELLPPLWQTLSYFNPLFYVINGFRSAMLSSSDVDISLSIFMLTLLGLFMTLLNYKLLKDRKNF